MKPQIRDAAYWAKIDAAIERTKRPPRPVRQEGETVKDHRFRVDVWAAERKRLASAARSVPR